MRNRRRIRSIKEKIKSKEALKKILTTLRKQGKRIAFTNGCFDVLHYGHVQYLETARALADLLVVAVNSDISIKKIKGNKRPIINQYDRLRIIASLESVDYVVLFNQNTPLELIRYLKPDIIIKGSDWDKKDIIGSDIVKEYGGHVKTIDLVSGRSTSNIIEKIAKNY